MINPKLMAALKAKRKPMAEAPAMSKGMEPMDAKPTDEKGPDYHHEQVRRHLEKGLSGTRRAAKIHMKMAKYHHDCACGRHGSK